VLQCGDVDTSWCGLTVWVNRGSTESGDRLVDSRFRKKADVTPYTLAAYFWLFVGLTTVVLPFVSWFAFSVTSLRRGHHADPDSEPSLPSLPSIPSCPSSPA
jgi:hypothetical protein